MLMKNSTTKIKLLVICLCAMTYSMNLIAQQTTLHLIQKEWILQAPTKKSFIFKIIFSQDKWKNAFIDKTGTTKDESPYYLSETPDTIFNINKVSKCSIGKYIIELKSVKHLDGSWHKQIEDFEILKLTDNNLELKHLASGSILQYKCK